MPAESINESVIYLQEFSGSGLTAAQMANCTSKMAGAGLSAKTARSYMDMVKKRWSDWQNGKSRGAALASLKGARSEMLSAVNQACDAVEYEIRSRK